MSLAFASDGWGLARVKHADIAAEKLMLVFGRLDEIIRIRLWVYDVHETFPILRALAEKARHLYVYVPSIQKIADSILEFSLYFRRGCHSRRPGVYIYNPVKRGNAGLVVFILTVGIVGYLVFGKIGAENRQKLMLPAGAVIIPFLIFKNLAEFRSRRASVPAFWLL